MEITRIQRNIRKYKDMLACAGYGIILFIIWWFLKEIIYLRWVIPGTDNINEQNAGYGVAIFAVILLGICLGTGFIAKRYGKSDKKEKVILIIFSLILTLFSLLVVAGDIILFVTGDAFDIFAIFAFIIDTLFAMFTMQINVCYFLLKKYYKQRREANYEC